MFGTSPSSQNQITFILLLFVVLIISISVFYYLLFLLVIESFFIIRYCCYVAEIRAGSVPEKIFPYKTMHYFFITYWNHALVWTKRY